MLRSGFFLGLTLSLPLLLAMAVNAYGLTTFGKSQGGNPPPPPPPQQPVPLGRLCQFEKDCDGIANTSCVPDPADSKSRCLCGDNRGPVNGVCKSKHKGLNHMCMANEECIEGSECMPVKDGGVRGVKKICKCSEGFIEIDYLCSGGTRLYDISIALMAVAVSLLMVASTDI